jgi:glycosyltransferase involved in cell wall biosynthesis
VIVHVCDHSNAIYTSQLRGVPHLVTCNDLLAIRSARGEFPAHRTRWSGRLLQRLILRGLRQARRITCISHATATDARRLVGDSMPTIDVTHMGLNHPYRPWPLTEARARVQALLGWPEPRPYLLHVGGEQWYKNRRGGVRLYAAHREAMGDRAPQLLLAGSSPADETAGLLSAHCDLGRNVQAPGEIDNETLRACYSAAELLVFPSLEEGFGWPILEAQACGCRVLTTGKAPMNEVGGSSPFYLPADPLADLASAVNLLQSALGEPEPARAARVAAGFENAARFSTAKMVDAYAAIYRELALAG